VNPASAENKRILNWRKGPSLTFFFKLSLLHLNTYFYIAFHCKRTLEWWEKGVVEILKAHSFSSPGSKTQKRSSNSDNKLNFKDMGGTVGKQATLLLRWKMNVPETKAVTDFLKRRTKKPNKALNMSKMKEVETHTCRSCTFQMQIMRHKPMEKTSAFYLWKTKERLPLLFSWLFWFYCRLPLFSPLFFSFTVTKGSKKKKPLCSPAICVFTPCLCCVFLFVSLFAVFFFLPLTLRFSLIFLPSLFYFSALFLPPLARSLEGFIYSLTYLYLGKIQCINSRMQIPADVQ